MTKKQAARDRQAKLERGASSKKRANSYNYLVGNLGNQLDQQAAQFFGKLLRNGEDGALSFANAESRKHVSLQPEKALSARTRLVRAGLIAARTWPNSIGADYTVTAKGFELVNRYWPSFRKTTRQLNAKPAQQVQPTAPKWIVVPPSRLGALATTSITA